ncbi:MAG: hypothetical protein AAGM46_22410 [Cyanobacteria bacterium J06582_2]
MNSKLNLNELVIIIGAKGLKPYPFNVDFLKQSAIVPEDWELAKKPLQTKQAIQSQFTNNVMFTAQPNRIVVTELIEGKNYEDILAPDLARKFINKLPKIDYRALVINPKGYVSFDNDSQAINNYIYQNLFNPAPWQEFGTAPVQSAIDLKYTLESGNLYLKIAQASINNQEQNKESVVLFSGNFEHGLTKENQSERALELQQYLAAWQSDLDTYQDLIANKFMNLAVQSSQNLAVAG